MSNTYLMAVDMGVSYVKIGIYDEKARLIHAYQEKVPGIYPRPGIFIQKAQDYLNIVLQSIRICLESSKIKVSSIECIGLSAAMGGAMGIDRDYEIAADWSIISDTRFNPYVLRLLEKKWEALAGISGTIYPVYAAKILWYQDQFPELHKKVHKYLFLCSYIAGKLANIKAEDAFIDRSHLNWTALADIAANTFSKELCRDIGIDQNKLPRIVNSYDVIGVLDKKMADLCGLMPGTPIIAGAGDKPAGSIGAGVVSNGLIIDESASFAALSMCVDRFVPDIANRTIESFISPLEGLYLPSIYINGSGVTHQWFLDNFCGDLTVSAQKKGQNAFKLLDAEATGIEPGSSGLMCVGLLGGRSCPFDPDIRGLWINHDWSHQRGHFWRALLESFAYEYAHALNTMRQNYPDICMNEIRVIGGAARSDFWNQIKCDVTGIPYVRLDRDDLTMLGDIILAGHAVGIYKDLKETCSHFFKKIKRYEPNERNNKYYKNFVNLYVNLFDRIRGLYSDLKSIPYYDK